MFCSIRRAAATALRAKPKAGRRLWIAATSSDPSLPAAVSQCAARIRATVSSHKQVHAGDACFALVSQSYPAGDVDGLASHIEHELRDVSPELNVAGTVVDRVFHNCSGDDVTAGALGVSILYYSSRDGDRHVEAGGAVQPALKVRPFFIGDIHGRQRLREVAVGRWHNKTTDRFMERQSSIRWDAERSSVTRATSLLALPQELTEGIDDPMRVRLILLASDIESRQTLDALDARFPLATTLGIVGSQTPFLNGREHTLYAGSRIYDSGMVGLAFVSTEELPLTPGADLAAGPQVSHGGLEAVSEVLRIERCKGNVVLQVENGDAAHSLISSARRPRMDATEASSDDSRLYARISLSREAAELPLLAPGSESVVFQVTGGDPRKGGLAIDTLRDIPQGSYIQFLLPTPRQPKEGSATEPSRGADSSDVTVKFGLSEYQNDCNSSNDCSQLPYTNRSALAAFGATSEGGFVYRRPCQPSSSADGTPASNTVFSGSTECAVPGSVVTLKLRQPAII